LVSELHTENLTSYKQEVEIMQDHIKNILAMRTSTVKNYGLPGVDSSLLGNGLVRIFESSRDQQESITPHSHKFDFSCLVLSGEVVNRTWVKDSNGDDFYVSELEYQGEIGKYKTTLAGNESYSYSDRRYRTGDWYSMKHDEIHSIWFSKGCRVLFLEGEVKTNKTVIIEPCVSGELLKTFEVRDWMFKR
jgi:hypothetical protein